MADSGPGIALEQPAVFTVLGIQFWDQMLDQAVTDGLTVTARLQDSNYMPVTAVRTGSGIYAFHHLPCLHDVEYPKEGSDPLSSPPKSFPFVITVSDTLQRFLPMLFVLPLPLSYRGVFLSNDAGSPPGSGRAYLFSAPTRAAAAGISVIRASLWDHDSDEPAAYAGLRASVDGREWLGIADDQGRVVIEFPSPLLKRLSIGSPPGSGQGPVSSMSWPVQVEVLYQPEKLRFPLASTPDVEWPWGGVPSLKSILHDQGAGLIWQQEAGPPSTAWVGDLVYGEDLILRTTPASTSTAISNLLISSAPTSP